MADYPKDPTFRERFGPRGVIRSSADGKVEDTGPLTKKRMETIDEEFLGAALKASYGKTTTGKLRRAKLLSELIAFKIKRTGKGREESHLRLNP